MTLYYDSIRTSFSPDRAYRYLLCRDLGFTGEGAVMFIMLNPSTADEYTNDPTIRRCVAFGKAWGFGTLQVTNLSPLRATDPKVLLETGPEPPDVWDENLDYIMAAAGSSKLVVAAWGIHGAAEGRADRVLAQLEPLKDVFCLGVTAKGFPRHPLYVPSETKVIHYRHGIELNPQYIDLARKRIIGAAPLLNGVSQAKTCDQ